MTHGFLREDVDEGGYVVLICVCGFRAVGHNAAESESLLRLHVRGAGAGRGREGAGSVAPAAVSACPLPPAPVELWEVLVPTVRRVGGRPYTTRFHRVWDAKVRAIAGGLTVMRPSVGYWTSPDGGVTRERMIPVRVACTEAQALAVAAMTLRYYDQLAVMLCRVSDKVVFVTDPKGGA